MDSNLNDQVQDYQPARLSSVLGLFSLVFGAVPLVLNLHDGWASVVGGNIIWEYKDPPVILIVALFVAVLLSVVSGGISLYLINRKLSIVAVVSLIVVLLTAYTPLIPIPMYRHYTYFGSVISFFVYSMYIVVFIAAVRKRWWEMPAFLGTTFALMGTNMLLDNLLYLRLAPLRWPSSLLAMIA